MGIYIKDLKMPKGGYRTIEIAYDADGHPMAIADGGDVFDVIPIADARPVVRGKWRLGGYGQISDATVKWYDQFLQGGFLYCSVCKGRTSVKFNFCPNCGADMRPEPPKEE